MLLQHSPAECLRRRGCKPPPGPQNTSFPRRSRSSDAFRSFQREKGLAHSPTSNTRSRASFPWRCWEVWSPALSDLYLKVKKSFPGGKLQRSPLNRAVRFRKLLLLMSTTSYESLSLWRGQKKQNKWQKFPTEILWKAKITKTRSCFEAINSSRSKENIKPNNWRSQTSCDKLLLSDSFHGLLLDFHGCQWRIWDLTYQVCLWFNLPNCWRH